MPTVYAACEGGGTTFVVAIAHDDPTNIVERAEFKTTSPAETIGKCCGARGTRPLPHTPGRRHPATGGGAPELAPTLVTAATPLTRAAPPLRPPPIYSYLCCVPSFVDALGAATASRPRHARGRVAAEAQHTP